MTALPPVIVLGVDTPIGLTIMRELGMRGVAVHAVGRSAQSIGAASRYAIGFTVRPPGQPLARWLPDLIEHTGARALLAISESDLIALAALDPVIAGCRILTPRAEPLGVVLDKRRTLAIAARLGLDIPRSWSPDSVDAALPAGMGWPLVLKWPDPMAVVDLLEAAGIAFEKAEFASDEPALRAILARYAPLGRFPIVQEYAQGHGIGQMLHMANGKATLRFQHERIHELPPEGGVSTLCRSLSLDQHAAQMEKSEALLAAIGWDGPAMVEYRHDAVSGRTVLMEVNGRFWGSQPLAFHAGAHFGWELYRRALLGETGQAPQPRAGISARFMIPETRRLLKLLRHAPIPDPAFRARPWRDLTAWFAGFLDPGMRYYVFSWRDPKPFLADLAGVIPRIVRRENPAPAPAPRDLSAAGR